MIVLFTFFFTAGSKKLTKIPLMRLIESLQRYLGVTPQAPKKQNKTDFVSCFLVSTFDSDIIIKF